MYFIFVCHMKVADELIVQVLLEAFDNMEESWDSIDEAGDYSTDAARHLPSCSCQQITEHKVGHPHYKQKCIPIDVLETLFQPQ